MPLELANVGGVFLVLVLGSLFACLLNFIQFLFYVKGQADDNNVSKNKLLFTMVQCGGKENFPFFKINFYSRFSVN